jgi:cation:H+ antiporter
VLLLLLAAWYVARMLGKKPTGEKETGAKISRHEGLKAFLMFMAGVLLVLVSSSFVVDSAVKLADVFGLAKSFIGATIIAVGTSLPELSVDIAAIRKKQFGLALGDAIGSNMVNLTLVLGAAAAINPIVLQLNVFVAALLFAVVANMAFLYLAVVKVNFGKAEGILLLSLYVLYLVLIFTLQAGEVALHGG